MNIEQRIDKEIKAYFYELPEVDDITVNIGAIRQFLMNLKNEFNASMPTNDQVQIVNRSIAGPHGEGNIPVRVYSPVSEKKNLPVLLWFHGGGFILESLETDHYWCTTIAHGVQCKVISVDYRLAPEHPFPAGVEDCYAALEWICSLDGSSGGIDKKRIAVGGASAGGNMAAAVSLMARDCKIASIYEGTSGIQAMDLLARKVGANKGAAFGKLVNEITCTIVKSMEIEGLAPLGKKLADAVKKMAEITAELGQKAVSAEFKTAFAHSLPYLHVVGDVIMAWMLLWRAVVASEKLAGKCKKKDLAFYKGEIQTAEFFMRTELLVTMGKMAAIQEGSSAAVDIDDEGFGGI